MTQKATLQPVPSPAPQLANAGARSSSSPSSQLSTNPFLSAQQALGNQALLQLLSARAVQTKLRVSQPGDPDELEADHIADRIVASAHGPKIHRKCACESSGTSCAKCQEEETTIHRSAASTVLHASPLSIQRAPAASDPAATPDKTADAPSKPSPTPSKTHPLVVEDDAPSVAPHQLRKSAFIALLRSDACTAADAILASVGHTTESCPYIAKWLAFYEKQSSAHIERALVKYAPETAAARSAHQAIRLVVVRIQRATLTWAKTGKISGLPDDLAAQIPGQGFFGAIQKFASSGIGGAILGFIGGRKPEKSADDTSHESGAAAPAISRKSNSDGGAAPAHDASAVRSQLGSGHSLDARVQSQMSTAFGHDFSGVRIHTDSGATKLSSHLNARAFTIGQDVAFASGEYQPGTPIGDALIAHELAHVVQQGAASHNSTMSKSADASASAGEASASHLENDADLSAVGAVASIWAGAKHGLSDIRANAIPRLRSGLRLQRCHKQSQVRHPTAPAPTDAAPEKCQLDATAQQEVQQLTSLFGFAAVDQEDGSCWTAHELNKVRIGLSRIPEVRRRDLNGVTLRRVGTSHCSGTLAEGCFKQDVDKQGVRHDVLEMPNSAFALDEDFEDTKSKTKVTRTDLSGTTIDSLPSQDVGLHEAGHAVETAQFRAADASRFRADIKASETQDAVNAAIKKISDSQVSSFNVHFSSSAVESAYQHALISTSAKVRDMVDAIGDPSHAHSAAIARETNRFKLSLKKAQDALKDLLAKKRALPPSSSVVMDDVETALQGSVAAGAGLATALDARLVAQQALDPAEAATKAVSATLSADKRRGRPELHISRRLAELIALVELKGLDIKHHGPTPYSQSKWPDHPEELFADLFQMSLTETPGLQAYDRDLAAFFVEPIGPKGHWKKDTADWIKRHTP